MNFPARLGNKYILLDSLGVGGMAEIFRGKLLGEEGFEKLIVIKKLLRQHDSDQEIVSHFIDEARLAALLEHENIASTYDFGNIDGAYFIAMEYLFGKDLHTAMKKLAGSARVFPPEIALYIIDKICNAMEYAHKVCDFKNTPLNIIHRDLTPHNIFLTYDGKIKVIDFGIAKTKFHEHRTQIGIVKGKVSYMSPEQVAGDTIDSRSDIFSIGILLYEMLCGKKVYEGSTATILSKALNGEYTPIETVLPSLPSQISAIVDKALQPKTETRYQTCGQMQADIHDYLHKLDQQVMAKTISEFTLDLFRQEYEQENKTASAIIDKTVYFSTKEMADQLIQELDKTTLLRTQDPGTGLFRQFLNIISENPILAIPLAAIVALLAFSLTAYFLYTPSAPEEIIAVNDVSREVKEPASFPRQNIQQQQISKKWQQRVEELLDQANLAYSESRLINSDDSAYSIYSDILLLDENNPHAINGLQRIAEQLDANGRESADRMIFSKADQSLDSLVKFFPQREENSSLEEYIDRKKQEKISQLEEKAEQAIGENRLKTPPAESAYTYYSQIKALDKNDSRWQDGYEKIADRYAQLAMKEFKNMQMEKARVYVHEGLLLDPDNPELLRLQTDLNRRGVVPYAKGFIEGIKDIKLF